MSRTATAPGKVMLAGEYAVLEGGQAVLVAVDRRVRAHVGQAPAHLSPFLQAVADEVCAYAGAHSPAAWAAARLRVDSSAFRTADDTKLGLGSSAAVTVAATACALDLHEPDPAPALVHRLAHAAHGRAQLQRGARGSGADIAAAVHGGVIAVRPAADAGTPVQVRPLAWRPEHHLVYVWTGKSADTPELVARVSELRQRDRAGYDQAITGLADAAEAVIAALRPSALAAELIAAFDAGARAVAALGRAAGVELETPVHRQIAALAHSHGGAAKPTGAGGGDIAVAVFASAEQASAFCAQAREQHLELLALDLDPAGVEVG